MFMLALLVKGRNSTEPTKIKWLLEFNSGFFFLK